MLEARRLLSNGTPQLLNDLNTNPAGSDPKYFLHVGNLAIFGGLDDAEKPAIFASDGTPSGTVQLAAAKLYTEQWQLSGPEDGVLYFAADDGVHGEELWRTDGTLAGTRMVADMTPGVIGDNILKISNFGDGTCVFMVESSGPDWADALWFSDGSADGTYQISDVAPSSWVNAAVRDGKCYFTPDIDAGSSTQLWETDGTAQGTRLVEQLVDPITDIGLLAEKVFVLDGANVHVSAGPDQPFDQIASLPKTSSAENLVFAKGHHISSSIRINGSTFGSPTEHRLAPAR